MAAHRQGKDMTGIIDYASLSSAVSSFLLRAITDRVVTAPQIQIYISLAEAEFNRSLRIPELEGETDLVTVAAQNYLALPADFKRISSLQYNTRPCDIEQSTKRRVNEISAGTNNGRSCEFALWAKKIWFGPTPDAAYTLPLDYYKSVLALDPVTNMTSSVLLAFPDLYLYGTLKQAQMQLGDITKGELWTANYNAIVSDIEKAATKEKMSSKLRARPSRGPIGNRMF